MIDTILCLASDAIILAGLVCALQKVWPCRT